MSASVTPPERLVCDSSFVAVSATHSVRLERFSHWPKETLDRLDRAILAISVITLAESRYGFLYAAWGSARIEQEERRLAGFLQIPLDLAAVDEWARLKALSRRNGWNVADNDLWIAATASARGHALVTCDGDQARIADPKLEVLYLPVPP